MKYLKTRLKKEFNIKNIVMIHYFEYGKNFCFKGEVHNFWEIVYVDKGEVMITRDKKELVLYQGEICFHKPNEYHNLRCDATNSPNIITIAFECKDEIMQYFANKELYLSREEKEMIFKILFYAKECFESDFGSPELKKLTKKENCPFASQQLIELYLCQLLISIKRRDFKKSKVNEEVYYPVANKKIYDSIINFLKENLEKNINFSDVVKYANVSGSTIKKLFSDNCNMGVMQYYSILKIEYSKVLIRRHEYNITQIANILCFDSIHYFSKKFKTITNMTPTQYAKSVYSIEHMYEKDSSN